jgi:hypothetical protein
MEEECVKRLSEWIIHQKRDAQKNFNNSNNSIKDIQIYIDEMKSIGNTLNRAIENENYDILKELNWPEDLVDCIKNMEIKTLLIDYIYESFNINPFNRSPVHESELQNEYYAGIN